MIESIGPMVFIPTLQKTKDGAPFSQIGTARSKAEPPADNRKIVLISRNDVTLQSASA